MFCSLDCVDYAYHFSRALSVSTVERMSLATDSFDNQGLTGGRSGLGWLMEMGLGEESLGELNNALFHQGGQTFGVCGRVLQSTQNLVVRSTRNRGLLLNDQSF